MSSAASSASGIPSPSSHRQGSRECRHHRRHHHRLHLRQKSRRHPNQSRKHTLPPQHILCRDNRRCRPRRCRGRLSIRRPRRPRNRLPQVRDRRPRLPVVGIGICVIRISVFVVIGIFITVYVRIICIVRVPIVCIGVIDITIIIA